MENDQYFFPKVMTKIEADKLFKESINSGKYLKKFNLLNYDIPFVFASIFFISTFILSFVFLLHFDLIKTNYSLLILLAFPNFLLGFQAGKKTRKFKNIKKEAIEFSNKILVDDNTRIGAEYCKKSLKFFNDNPEYKYYVNAVIEQDRKLLIDEIDFLLEDHKKYTDYCNCEKLYKTILD